MPRLQPLIPGILGFALLIPFPGLAGELRTVAARAAPALELPDLAGVTRTLDAWRGQVVLINFWASWCQPCLEEMPGIQRLAERMQGRPFTVIGVNVAEMQRRAAQAVARLGLAFPVLLDAEGATFHAWGGTALPTSALIDRQGALRYVGLGPLDWEGPEAVAAVEGLLAEEPGPTGTADKAASPAGPPPGSAGDP